MLSHLARSASLLLGVPLFALAQQPNAPAKKPKPPGAACGTHCGTERWTIKTLTDGKSAAVISSTPTQSSISALVALPAPATLPQSARVAPTELQQFTVQALLIGWKEEADSDLHLVLADPTDHGKTMIAEIPSPRCASACASAKVGAFGAARQVLTTELGAAPKTTSLTLLNPPRKVDVTGVGFFDFAHKQDGLALNCIELHPVLQIAITGSETGGAIALPSGVSHKCGSTAGGGAGGKHSPPHKPAGTKP